MVKSICTNRRLRSPRKLRLAAVACCRRYWDFLTDERSRRAITVAERFADGLATRAELDAAAADARRVHSSRGRLAVIASFVAAAQPGYAACYTVHHSADPVECDLLRDIFNPFRRVPVNPAWLSWSGGTATRLARVIYEERRFADLPVLADALEEAGCAGADLLDHCRSGGDHVRGCWVVDALLAKA
jgi:hypothetical protein